jgi:hypothetical protein
MLGACSGSFESPHLGAAFLAEDTQRVYSSTVHELSYLRKRFVRCKIRLDNHSNDGLRRFHYGRARQDPHLAYQRVHADQCSDLRLVVRSVAAASMSFSSSQISASRAYSGAYHFFGGPVAAACRRVQSQGPAEPFITL